jgi:hypothetical protein
MTIAGDVPALGRLVITEAQAVDQSFLIWGVQSRYYDPAASAALDFEAESRTPLGGSATAVGPAGASGSGSNTILTPSLSPTPVAVMSTQASGGGSHVSHAGDFRVFVRCQPSVAAAGDGINVAWEWSSGDFGRSTRNASVALNIDASGKWWLVDLGTVSIPKVAQGVQRWEGRLVASSFTVSSFNFLYIDHIALIPITEGSGQVTASIPLNAAPTTFLARDEFTQSAGALAGKTLPIGGTWAGAGDADDFQVTGAGKITRTAVSDVSLILGRFALAGTGTATNIDIRVDVTTTTTSAGLAGGVLCRYVDTSNWLAAVMQPTAAGFWMPQLYKTIAGATTTIGNLAVANSKAPCPANATVRLLVDAGGRWWMYVYAAGSKPILFTQGQDAALAAGGTLASGRYGLYENYGSATAATRTYDNLAAAAFTPDAVLFASRSAEIRHDRFTRQDSAGAVWSDKSIEGDFLLVPCSGREGRTARLIVTACRNNPAVMPDTAIDDLTCQLSYTPRFLSLPE